MRKGKEAQSKDAEQQAENMPKMRDARFVIGIDPGTNTGFSVWDLSSRSFLSVETLSMYRAIKRIEGWVETAATIHRPGYIFVRIEDATKRTWFGKSGPERYKGAGSIERDCAIWREVLTELNIPFEAVAPKDLKGTPNAETFKKITGWQRRTSVHARDAAWMVYGI